MVTRLVETLPDFGDTQPGSRNANIPLNLMFQYRLTL
jgi:hypothetical protein